MSFTRSFLKSMSLSDEQISAIMEEHTAVTTALKDQRDQYKAEAEKLPGVQKQLSDLQNGEDYKAKYDKEHQEFEDYKAKVAREADEAKVRAAYRKLLADEKISEKRLDSVLKVTDFSGMKLDKEGNLDGSDKLRETIRKEWADFITETRERGATVETPPDSGKPARSKADILAIKDTAERQKAIAENLNLFGH